MAETDPTQPSAPLQAGGEARNLPVPIPRPRDIVRARMHPAFAPLYERLWRDLSLEVYRDYSVTEAA